MLQETLVTKVTVTQITYFLGIGATHAPSSKPLWLLILSSSLNYKCIDIMKSSYNYDLKYFCILLLSHDMSKSDLVNLLYSISSSTVTN